MSQHSLVVLGASAGGLPAVVNVLERLPQGFPAPVHLIVTDGELHVARAQRERLRAALWEIAAPAARAGAHVLCRRGDAGDARGAVDGGRPRQEQELSR
jgi:chemotaxis response regulator CheB